MATSAQKLLLRVAPWLLPVGTVIIWQLASSVGWLSTRILPSPEGVLKAFWTLSASGELWQHLAISSWRALLGFAIGGSIGLVLGLISGLSRWGERLLDTSIQMLRNVPHLALIPLVILWFGIDESAKIFLVALGTMFPIYINTWHGIRNIDRGLVEMARSYGLSGVALFRHVILPGALPSIMVGIRFALGLMWLTLIVAETISANAGIGYLAMNAWWSSPLFFTPFLANWPTSARSCWNASGYAGTRLIIFRRPTHDHCPSEPRDPAVA